MESILIIHHPWSITWYKYPKEVLA